MERHLQNAARMMSDERRKEPQVLGPWYGLWGGWGFPRGSGAPTPNTPNTPNSPSFPLEDDDRADEQLVQPAAALAPGVMTEAVDEDFADAEAEMQAAVDAEVCAQNPSQAGGCQGISVYSLSWTASGGALFSLGCMWANAFSTMMYFHCTML